MRPGELDIIFFDAGGTLLYPEPPVGVAYSRAAARHGIEVTPGEVDRSFAEAWRALNRGGAPQDRDWWRGIVRATFRDHGVADDPEALFDELYEHFRAPGSWRLFPGVAETLDALRGRGYRTGLISNWDERLPEVLEGLSIRRGLEPEIVSDLVGAEKPDPEIFRIALRRAGVAPERALMVGDDPVADVEGARSVGMRALRVDWSLPASGQDLGPGVLRSIADLPDLLAEMGLAEMGLAEMGLAEIGGFGAPSPPTSRRP